MKISTADNFVNFIENQIIATEENNNVQGGTQSGRVHLGLVFIFQSMIIG